MNRRSAALSRRMARVLAPAIVVGALVSSCATFSANDQVARVGDVALARDDFESYVAEVLEVTQPGLENTTIEGDRARGAVSQWIIDELIRQYLADQGIEITDADREAAQANLAGELEAQGITLSERTTAFLVESAAARGVFDQTQEPGSLLEFATGADVSVDPVYGVWDVDAGSVVPAG